MSQETFKETAKPLLPTTERLLRGIATALSEMDVADRPDLKHSVNVIGIMINHLLLRQDLTPFPDIYTDIIGLAEEGRRFLKDAAALNAAAEALPRKLPANAAYDDIQFQIGLGIGYLRDVMKLAIAEAAFGAREYAAKILAVENRFYAANHRQVNDRRTRGTMEPLRREAFEDYLSKYFPGKFTGVTKFQRLNGGLQKDTILVDCALPQGGVEAMVIRAEKHDRFARFTASEITDECEIVHLAFDAGVPVAEPLWLEADPERLGRRFMVSQRALGHNIGGAYGDAAKLSPALTRSFMETLVRIQKIPLDRRVASTKLGAWLQYKTLPENTLHEVRLWRHQAWIEPAPPSASFARIFDWLEANVPEDDLPPCIVHNDFGPHNIIVREDKVQAVLDWEISRLGDPAGDLSFFLQCCGEGIDVAETVRVYRELSGNDVSEYRLRYFDVLSCAKVLMANYCATAMYQGTDPALLDWCQIPILSSAAYQGQIESRIAAAEAVRR